MFRSIRWRLVISYVLLTLLTVSVLGAITYTLVQRYIISQEDAFLIANAEAIESQARLLMSPKIQYEDLEELARAISMLGNLRVIIHNDNHEVIVDSGSPPSIDHFLWIRPDVNFRIEPSQGSLGPFMMPLLEVIETDVPLLQDTVQDLIDNLPNGIHYEQVQINVRPWGNLIQFKDTENRRSLFTLGHTERTFSIPIGESEDPLGYVKVLEGPDFGAETLERIRHAFLIAAGSSLVLSGIIGLLISKRLTSPIVQLSAIADQMSSGDLSVRSPDFGVDEIGQLSQQFNQMSERLEETFTTLASERDTLRRFITDASHELRTPITALKNFNELLVGSAREDPQAGVEFLSQSQDQIERLEWITQNLLDLSRLEAGLKPLIKEERDVREILGSITSTFITQAEKKNIRFLIDHPDPTFDVYADQSLLEIALTNLLDNAMKYTSEGGKIKLAAHEEEDKIRFQVQDTGTGIDSGDLPHVFERFYRGKSTTIEGSGLGLAMVDSVVKAHGGTVHVESEPGIGSTFTLELPKSY